MVSIDSAVITATFAYAIAILGQHRLGAALVRAVGIRSQATGALR